MKFIRLARTLGRGLAVTALLATTPLATTPAWAIPVPLDHLKSEATNYYNLAIDQSSGAYYQRRGYQGESQVRVYDGYGDFVANNASSTLTLQTPGPYGFYSAVEDGKLLGRSTPHSTGFAAWDLTSGARESNVNVAGFEPRNSVGTFNYAGYTAFNPISNASGTYITSKDLSSSQWRVETMDSDLNHSLVGHVDISAPGFAFMIGDFMFFGEDFRSNQISHRYDVTNNVTSAVDFELLLPPGINSNVFWTNAIYDSTTDNLLTYNVNTRDYFGISNAASVFGVSASVPEPGTLALLGLGLLSLTAFRSRNSWRAKV